MNTIDDLLKMYARLEHERRLTNMSIGSEQAQAMLKDQLRTVNTFRNVLRTEEELIASLHKQEELIRQVEGNARIHLKISATASARIQLVKVNPDALDHLVVQNASQAPIAKPPGYWMDRIARGAFFFWPKKLRVFEEIIADYRHEMIEAEAKRAPARRLRTLRFQHWGGFILSLIDEIASGLLGKIVKVLKGN